MVRQWDLNWLFNILIYKYIIFIYRQNTVKNTVILHKSKSFPCRAREAARNSEGANSACANFAYWGIVWGCVLQKRLSRDRPLLPPPEIPHLGFPINLQENRHYCLRNIFKRSAWCLECSRIAFVLSGDGVGSLKGINRVKTQNSGTYALVGF